MFFPTSLGTLSFKKELFVRSRKLDSALMVCNTVLKIYPKNTAWLSQRGKLYKDLGLLTLSNRDFAIVKARVLNSLNTIDTLQHKNLNLKFVEAYCAKEMGEQALAKELLQKLNAKFPEDKDLKKGSAILLSETKQNSPSVIKYRINPIK